MTQAVLEVSELTKIFRIYRSEWHRVASWFGASPTPSEQHVVLDNVSFGIVPGQTLGIVGQNGAGKSTLLKLITGTLAPTHGTVTARGRIAAILELGLGFNPELTGRQNVRHSAGLMGFTQSRISELMPEIEAFAEVGEYFDQPVRTYSSGMQMRIAFSVATAVRPEVLIVDEALSVGDAYFQHKSAERIRAFRERGTALLLVSHDPNAIHALCDRAILLEGGVAIKDGDPEEVFDFYNAIIAKQENSTVEVTRLGEGKAQTTSGTGEARVEAIGLYNREGEPVQNVGVGESVELRIKVRVNQDIDSLVLGYGIKDRLGQVMYGTNTWHTGQVIESPGSDDIYQFTLLFQMNLGVGSYSVQTALVDRDTHLSANYEWRDMALLFNVINIDRVQFSGCSWCEPRIAFEELSS